MWFFVVYYNLYTNCKFTKSRFYTKDLNPVKQILQHTSKVLTHGTFSKVDIQHVYVFLQ